MNRDAATAFGTLLSALPTEDLAPVLGASAWHATGNLEALKLVMKPLVCRLERDAAYAAKFYALWLREWADRGLAALMLLVVVGEAATKVFAPHVDIPAAAVEGLLAMDSEQTSFFGAEIPALMRRMEPGVVNDLRRQLQGATPDALAVLATGLAECVPRLAPIPGYVAVAHPRPESATIVLHRNTAEDMSGMLTGEAVSLMRVRDAAAWRQALGIAAPDCRVPDATWTEADLFANAASGPVLVEGGCRMLDCNCAEDGDTDDIAEIPRDTWFQGWCDQCGQTIRVACHALRTPLPDGCWAGCYCSVECVSCTTDDETTARLRGCVWLGVFANI